MRSTLLVLLVAGCGFAGAEMSGARDAQLASARATRVEVVVLEPSAAEVELMLPGEVIGARDVVLGAGNGGLVESLRVRRGTQVNAGQSIARVDAQLFGAQVAQAEAQAEQAASELERQQALGDLGAAAELQRAEVQSRVARANADQAAARMARALVRAPFAGTVADLYLEEGAHAAPGAPIARLVQLDPVRVTLAVSDRDVVSLSLGMPVQVRTHARSEVFEGEIHHIGPAADMRTRAFPVEARVPNPDGRLLPGMIAQVHLVRPVAVDAVVVPQDWIVTRRTNRGVFVEEDGVAHWRPVVLGDVARDQIVVLEGLTPGERVVITGHRDLVDGEALLVARAGRCCTDGRPTWGE